MLCNLFDALNSCITRLCFGIGVARRQHLLLIPFLEISFAGNIVFIVFVEVHIWCLFSVEMPSNGSQAIDLTKWIVSALCALTLYM